MAAQVTFVSILVAAATLAGARSLAAQGDALPPPAFHHLHVNPVDPGAAIAGYLKLWPETTKKTTVAGFDALEKGPSREAIEIVELR